MHGYPPQYLRIGKKTEKLIQVNYNISHPISGGTLHTVACTGRTRINWNHSTIHQRTHLKKKPHKTHNYKKISDNPSLNAKHLQLTFQKSQRQH